MLPRQRVAHFQELAPYIFLFAFHYSQHGSNFTGSPVLPSTALSSPGIYTQHIVRMFLHASFCLSFSLSLSPSWEQGEHGVEEVLNILKNEFHTSMTLTGKFLQFFS